MKTIDANGANLTLGLIRTTFDAASEEGCTAFVDMSIEREAEYENLGIQIVTVPKGDAVKAPNGLPLRAFLEHPTHILFRDSAGEVLAQLVNLAPAPKY